MLASLGIVTSFVELLTPLRTCFKRRMAFENFIAVLWGLALAMGRGTISSALLAAGLVGHKHWSAFYRLFSRATWDLDQLGLAVARLLVARLAGSGTLVLIVDDTLHAKSGKNVFGAGMHHDPLTSTRAQARFQFGHCWVVLALSVKLPFDLRTRALPILFRLNMPKKMADKWGVKHQKKTEQALLLVKLAADAFPDRRLLVVGDNLYSCETLLQGLPKRVDMVGRLPLTARLHAAIELLSKPHRGRPNTWGKRLPAPGEQARDERAWTPLQANLYGRDVTVQTKATMAFWRSGRPDQPLHCVTVWRPDGQYPYEAFFSTVSDHTVTAVLETFALRWQLEVTFHETKDSLGADRNQPWTKNAVLRTAPTVMLLYSVIVLWYAEHGHALTTTRWPLRPWYRQKKGPSFDDMLVTLRRASLHLAIDERPVPDSVVAKSARRCQQPGSLTG
jgi:hypothetical protein